MNDMGTRAPYREVALVDELELNALRSRAERLNVSALVLFLAFCALGAVRDNSTADSVGLLGLVWATDDRLLVGAAAGLMGAALALRLYRDLFVVRKYDDLLYRDEEIPGEGYRRLDPADMGTEQLLVFAAMHRRQYAFVLLWRACCGVFVLVAVLRYFPAVSFVGAMSRASFTNLLTASAAVGGSSFTYSTTLHNRLYALMTGGAPSFIE
jgi:hypothetical protein